MENWASKEALFKCPVPRERHTIDGIGDVWIWGLTCGEKDDYENDVYKITAGSREVKTESARAVLIQRTVHDQHGNLFFAESDIGRIKTMSALITDPIYDKARRLSGMVTSAAEVKDKEKNLQKAPTGGCGTGSQPASGEVSTK